MENPQIPNPPVPPEPTQPKALVTPPAPQPVSVHANSATHWSLIVAAIGLPILAALVIGGLFLLPESTFPGNEGGRPGILGGRNDDTDGDTSEDEEDELETRANPSEPPSGMRLMTVRNAEERGAICNDGTPAKYYFSAGTETDKDKWIIFFKGGGGCGTEESCIDRSENEDPGLISSNPYPKALREGGILSSNPERNEGFYGWNHVKLMYCSSDNWSGNSDQLVGGETWYFHGKAIVEAIIEDLQNPEVIQTENLSAASTVLVAGSSAGGGGAAHNIDDIAVELPNAEVKGFVDSSWSYDVEAYAVSEESSEYSRDGINDFHNKVLDDTCVAALGEAQSACSYLSGLYPYLETPTFIFMNQHDNLKLGNLGINFPIDAAERAWVDTVFVPGLLDSYEVIEDGLFSPAESFHTLLTDDLYFTTELEGVTVEEAFTNWFFEREGETYLVETE